MTDLQRKVRNWDLNLNRLIKYREGRESSYFTFWNRWPSLHLPSFPASPLALCWRWGALSNGVCLSNELSGVKERGRDHWPKKPYFRRFSASWPRKLSPGFQICSLGLNFLALGLLHTCSANWSHLHTGAFSSQWHLHGRLAGIAKAAGMLLLFKKSRYLWLKLLILNSSNINRYKNIKDNK